MASPDNLDALRTFETVKEVGWLLVAAVTQMLNADVTLQALYVVGAAMMVGGLKLRLSLGQHSTLKWVAGNVIFVIGIGLLCWSWGSVCGACSIPQSALILVGVPFGYYGLVLLIARVVGILKKKTVPV